MYTYTISRNNNIIATLKNQNSDLNLLGKMLKIQSNSMFWAIKYEGYKIECENEETGEKQQLKAFGSYFTEWVKI